MVLNGIDCIHKYSTLFAKKRLGLITSVSGVDCCLNSSINIIHKEFRLSALYSPEHGVRGDIEAGRIVDAYRDPYTNVPVYSLYRKDSKHFTEEMLRDVDAVIYDIQDIGARYYTFISTLLYALEDCGRYGKELIVLDRYNPLGNKVEGNLLDGAYESFVGSYKLCIRHGLTVGEFAAMVNKERRIGCNLTVIPCENWSRDMMFPDMGNVWIMPSPGIPRFDTALLYAGTCLFEGTNVSEGRGTAAPFEMIGAPYINAPDLAALMNARRLPGVLFSPIYFNPNDSKYEGKQCGGIHAHITDYHAFEAVRTGIELLFSIKENYPEEFEFLPPFKEGGRRSIELLFGGSQITNPDYSKEDILSQCNQDSAVFTEYKKSFHIYN